jgi:hypothetical protein
MERAKNGGSRDQIFGWDSKAGGTFFSHQEAAAPPTFKSKKKPEAQLLALLTAPTPLVLVFASCCCCLLLLLLLVCRAQDNATMEKGEATMMMMNIEIDTTCEQLTVLLQREVRYRPAATATTTTAGESAADLERQGSSRTVVQGSETHDRRTAFCNWAYAGMYADLI